MRNIRECILGFLTIILLISSQVEADLLGNEEDLRGIDEVVVLIASDVLLKEHGINSVRLQKDIELKLRMAGITVESMEEAGGKDCPILLVGIRVMYDTKMQLYNLNYEVKVIEKALLARNKKAVVAAAIWENAGCAITKYVSPNVVEQILNGVKIMVDDFLNDYLAVNSKR